MDLLWLWRKTNSYLLSLWLHIKKWHTAFLSLGNNIKFLSVKKLWRSLSAEIFIYSSDWQIPVFSVLSPWIAFKCQKYLLFITHWRNKNWRWKTHSTELIKCKDCVNLIDVSVLPLVLTETVQLYSTWKIYWVSGISASIFEKQNIE